MMRGGSTLADRPVSHSCDGQRAVEHQSQLKTQSTFSKYVNGLCVSTISVTTAIKLNHLRWYFVRMIREKKLNFLRI